MVFHRYFGESQCLMRVTDVGLGYKFVDLFVTCQWLSLCKKEIKTVAAENRS